MQAVPKMELTGSKGPKKLPSKFPRYASLTSLIKALGEFTLVSDPSDTIVGFWTSGRPLSRRLIGSILGRPLDGFVQPVLLAEIKAMAARTAAGQARAEFDCPISTGRLRRWFSVCAIPLHPAGLGPSALCVAARNVTHRVDAMRSLADREALLAKAEEIANFGSWEFDVKTGHEKCSAQLRKIYQLSPAQTWSVEMYWQRMHPSDRQWALPLANKARDEGRPVECLARYCAPDGRVRLHRAHVLPVIDQTGKVVRAMGVIHDVTEHAASHEELRRLSQQLMNEQDSQRRRLARELHESAGQSLASLKMTLGRLREAVGENPDLVSDLLDSAAHLTDGAIRELRTVTYLLHPPMLDESGLASALSWYTKGFAERSGITTQLDISESFQRFSQDIETTVFRIVQEALTNVHRYSGSRSAAVQLWHEGANLHVEIRDQGCGFPPAAERRTEMGVGISGMRERVKQLNGVFEISSVPGKGTTVRAILPVVPVTRLCQSSTQSPDRADEMEKRNAPQAQPRS